MIVSQKSCKKQVMPSAIPIIKKEKKLYTEIYYSNKDIANSNYALF